MTVVRVKLAERYKVLKLYTLLLSHSRLLAVTLSVSAIATALGVVPPLLTRAVVDQGVLAGNAGAILLYAGALAAVYVATTVVSAIQSYFQSLLSGKVALDLRSKVFAKAVELGAELYEGRI